nr:PREDICTED: erythroid differentiation-related factor 1 [Bemisia tabaci]XP_018900110.1 PREDICTED: erythroid differentiation-related factor 1 [Bemisia tabaci]XP_018900111.1 PREDICTED: erythroid differentiation-related factor 1 [Bemisia tabaci]
MEETVENTLPVNGEKDSSVKSTAVVKYSKVQVPATFARLQCNTDLKLPPSNWLSSSAESYGLQHVLPHPTGFSSFRMAHMFPDCMGEVDVVSDAENIKKLLKIPYSSQPVSMMIHRVENTLLIDEFDIHKHLIQQAENNWEWLKKFFFEHILSSLNSKDKHIPAKNASLQYLQQKSLVSKFLHYSLADTGTDSEASNKSNEEDAKKIHVPQVTSHYPYLPEPQEELPDPSTNHDFSRNVIWTFENIQMLLGTDMPIFGGGTHPCISLRLRDSAKPISVLTGIDYWLDNLMCNVPEVVMCYHLDGIVQKYEIVKTEDLPNMDNCQFSPELIRDVAQNILSFLKSNATKAGHTYWLFKGKGEEVVKLYDLSSLCSEDLEEKGQNPFTIPVAMLLYRVARNMKHSTRKPTCKASTIRMLLENSITLLPKEKYPQIITSAHYMLSDLFVPANTDPTAPGLEEESSEDSNDLEDEMDNLEEAFESLSNSVPIQALCSSASLTESKYHQPPPLTTNIEERCEMALVNISNGLDCLKFFTPEEKEPKQAKPFEAIPMPYSSLDSETSNSNKSSRNNPKKSKKGRKKELQKDMVASDEDESEGLEVEVDGNENTILKALLCKTHNEAVSVGQQPPVKDSLAWSVHLKTLLVEKACLVYATLAEEEYNLKRFGKALKHYKFVMYIRALAASSDQSKELISYLLGRCGDCYFQIARDWMSIEKTREDLKSSSMIDERIWNQIKKDSQIYKYKEDLKLIPDTIPDFGETLLQCCHCYERALQHQKIRAQRNILKRRLGNVHNELGAFYMNQAEATVPFSSETVKSLFRKSQEYLDKGIKLFEAVKDDVNLALLHSNEGRLMRLIALYHSQDQGAFSPKERHFYNKALSSYQKAMAVIGCRSNNPMVWDTVNWELSTASFTLASMVQDYSSAANQSVEESEKEVAELLLKALKYCDLETETARLPVYQYRAAKIHYRLASLYHSIYRHDTENENKKKHTLQLCYHHYDKACHLFLHLEHPSEFLRVILENVALNEFIAANSNKREKKRKLYQDSIKLFSQSAPILALLSSKITQDVVKAPTLGDGSEKNQSVKEQEKEAEGCKKENLDIERKKERDLDKEEEVQTIKLLSLFEQRLQFILLSLTKLCRNNSQSRISCMAPLYKNIYSLTLKRSENDLVPHLLRIVKKLLALES